MALFNWPYSQSSQTKAYLISQRNRLFRVAYSWCHSDALADDLVQETLLRALKYGKPLRNDKAMDGWLFRILANCWHDELRRRHDTQDINDYEFHSSDNTEEQHYRTEILTQVYQAMSKLPEAQREVVSLIDIAELSYEETAKALDVPVGTVMSRLNRARLALRDRLEKKCRQPAGKILPFGASNE